MIPYTTMYQTARMLETTLSRSEFEVFITRLAIRPAKSFWKKFQLCRITCQWLCQRINVVTPGITALLRTIESARIASGRAISTRAAIASSSGACASTAARGSGVVISPTSLPMKRGITVSSRATVAPNTNIATYSRGDWRTKCR